MKLSIIIVNYKSADMIIGLIDSIYNGTKEKDHEIIIVDNYSNDGGIKQIKERYPDIKVIENPDNLGFATAVNRGIKASRGQYLLILNPDIIIKPGAIDVLIKSLDDDPRAGAAGGKILNPDGSIQLSGKSFPDPMVMLFVTLGLHKILPHNPVTDKYYHSTEDYGKKHQVEHLMASFLMVKREAIDKAGMMDEKFFLYCEDVDWCYRIHMSGYEIWYLPDSEVVHVKGATTSKNSYRAIVEYHKSAWYFYRKYYWDKYPILLSLSFYIGLQLRKYLYLIVNFFSKDKKVNY